MNPEQKEAFRREVLEEAAKLAERNKIVRDPYGQDGETIVVDYWDSYEDLAAAIRALAASQPAPAADAVMADSKDLTEHRKLYDRWQEHALGIPAADTGQAVALEWETDKPELGSYAEQAHTPFGYFRIEKRDKDFQLTGPGLLMGWDADIVSAKTAVQEYFEDCIQWCLPHPAPLDAERVRELETAIANADLRLRSIRYHADNGHQDRPLHVRLSLISKKANEALAALRQKEGE